MMTTINTQTLAEILSKPSINRLDFEIRAVCGWLREKVKYFKKLSDDILQTLVIECTAVKLPASKVVIWEGEIGDCMYILLSGKLHVHRLNEPDKDDVVNDEPKELFPQKIREEPFIEDPSILGQCLATLESGHIFGEVALIEKCMRTASVVTTEECEIVIIPRELYDSTVAPVLEEEFKMKLEFIESVTFFSCCSPRHKKQLLMAIESHSCDYPTQIIKQGERVSAMYFLMSGEIRLSCEPQYHTQQFQKSINSWSQQESYPKSTEKQIMQNYQKQKKQFTLPKSFDVCLLNQKNQDFGNKPCICDMELLLNLPCSAFTATATSHCVILVLHARHFDRILLKRNPASILTMLELSYQRIEHWSGRLKSVLPILDIFKERTLFSIRNLKGFKGPITLEQMLNKNDENIYQYSPPTRGAIIDIFGPGTAFYYIRNQYHLRQQNKKYNRNKQLRQNYSKPLERNFFQSSVHLQRPNEKSNYRTEIFSKDIGYGTHYDNHTKELENRIENFLRIMNKTKPTIVEPLSDVLEKIPKMKYPKRGNLVILKPVNKPQKYLNDSNLSAEESIRMFLENKSTN